MHNIDADFIYKIVAVVIGGGAFTVLGKSWDRIFPTKKQKAESKLKENEAEKSDVETDLTVGEAWKKFAEEMANDRKELKDELESALQKIKTLENMRVQDKKDCDEQLLAQRKEYMGEIAQLKQQIYLMKGEMES